MALYLTSSSDDSEDLENFYASLRPKSQPKYRLSNGSLNDFIADDDEESIMSNEEPSTSPSKHDGSQLERKLNFSQSSSDEKENTPAPKAGNKKKKTKLAPRENTTFLLSIPGELDMSACSSKVSPRRRTARKPAQVGLNITNTRASKGKDITKLLDAYLSSSDDDVDEENMSGFDKPAASSSSEAAKRVGSSNDDDDLEDSLIRQLTSMKVSKSPPSSTTVKTQNSNFSEGNTSVKSEENEAVLDGCPEVAESSCDDDDLEDSLIRQIRNRKVNRAAGQTLSCTKASISFESREDAEENEPVGDSPGADDCCEVVQSSSEDDDLESSLIRQIKSIKVKKPSSPNCTKNISTENKDAFNIPETSSSSDDDDDLESSLIREIRNKLVTKASSSTVGQMTPSCTSRTESKELNRKVDDSDDEESPIKFKTPAPLRGGSRTMAGGAAEKSVLFSSSDEDEMDVSLLHRITKKLGKSSTAADDKVDTGKKVKESLSPSNSGVFKTPKPFREPKTPKPFREPRTPAGGSSLHSQTVTFSSSDEEDSWEDNLLYRITKKSNIDLSDCSYFQDDIKEINKKKNTEASLPEPIEISSSDDDLMTTPSKVMADNERSILENSAPRRHRGNGGSVCKVEGCFLSTLQEDSNSKQFKKDKEKLTSDLFKLYNSSVFDNLLPADMIVDWSKRMTKTAGVTRCRRVVSSSKDSTMKVVQYQAKISLSEKVITTPQRLRDTLIHEMCHAAVWVLDHANESHGPRWKHWGRRSCTVHPELPMMERCHMYAIEYKYIYECTGCSVTVGRHSKSLDTTKWACSRCKSRLQLRTNKKTQAPLTPFAKFVKENYKTTKEKIGEKGKHVDVMKQLSERFKSASSISSKK